MDRRWFIFVGIRLRGATIHLRKILSSGSILLIDEFQRRGDYTVHAKKYIEDLSVLVYSQVFEYENHKMFPDLFIDDQGLKPEKVLYSKELRAFNAHIKYQILCLEKQIK